MSQRILTRCLRYTSPHRYCVKLNAPPKFSRSIHLRRAGKGGRERGAKQGWEMWERERVDSQYSGVARRERRRRKEGRQAEDAGARVRAKGIWALRTSRSLQTLGGNVHACYYIPRLNRKLSSQTSSGEARCAITLPSFKLLSRRVTYVTALRGYL